LLRLTALDEAGRPLPWVRVYFVEAPVPVPEIAALTDAGGTVTLEAPAPGLYRVGLAAEGYEAETVAVVIGEAGTHASTVVLKSQESAR
jgi:hypothetical protein